MLVLYGPCRVTLLDGVMNGLYYALVAAFTWKIVRLLPQEILGISIVGSPQTTAASGVSQRQPLALT